MSSDSERKYDVRMRHSNSSDDTEPSESDGAQPGHLMGPGGHFMGHMGPGGQYMGHMGPGGQFMGYGPVGMGPAPPAMGAGGTPPGSGPPPVSDRDLEVLPSKFIPIEVKDSLGQALDSHESHVKHLAEQLLAWDNLEIENELKKALCNRYQGKLTLCVLDHYEKRQGSNVLRIVQVLRAINPAAESILLENVGEIARRYWDNSPLKPFVEAFGSQYRHPPSHLPRQFPAHPTAPPHSSSSSYRPHGLTPRTVSPDSSSDPRHRLSTESYPPRETRSDSGNSTNSDRSDRSQRSSTSSKKMHSHQQPKRPIHVVVTFTDDDEKHLDRVVRMAECIKNNRFGMTVDMPTSVFESEAKGREFVTTLRERFKAADFVVVCASPKLKYISEAPDRPVDTHYHAAEIYKWIKKEIDRSQSAARFIPVLFAGVRPSCVPTLLRLNQTYRWPEQFMDVLFKMTKPKRLVQQNINKMSVVKQEM